MLASTLLIMALMVGLSDTPAGQALRRMAGAAKLPRITRGWLILVATLLGIVAAAALLAKGEGLALSAPLLPEGLAWAAAFDVVAYVDVIAVMVIVAASVRLRLVWVAARSAIKRSTGLILSMRGRASEREARPRRSRPKKPAADDERRWGLAWAA